MFEERMNTMYTWNDGTYLAHHGIKGQKWGIRRFQNEDGSYTAAGRARYGITGDGYKKATNKEINLYKSHVRSELYGAHSPEDDKIRKLEEKAYKLAEKYDFDGDDGGGGTTAADRRAGAQYMKYFDQIAALEHLRDERIERQVSDELLKKFGKENLDSYEARRKIKMGAVIGASMLAIYGGMTIMMAQDIGYKSALAISGATAGATAGIVAVAAVDAKKKQKQKKK